MKRITLILTLAIGLILINCESDINTNFNDDFQYKATVINKGIDCGETWIIELKNINGNSEIEDGTYYADNLGVDYKESGLKVYLSCREPNNDELYPCTTLGPSYPHLIVIKSKKA